MVAKYHEIRRESMPTQNSAQTCQKSSLQYVFYYKESTFRQIYLHIFFGGFTVCDGTKYM